MMDELKHGQLKEVGAGDEENSSGSSIRSKRTKSSEDDSQPSAKRSKKGTDDDRGRGKRRGVSSVNTKTKSSSGQAPCKGTYPKPKNFAERMMNVLENNVNPDVIKWDGKDDLIAVNTKALKSSDILDTRFQGIRYAAFIRNLSRWGFRKVPKLDAPDGVVVYRNSLFQRENPHLVRHMKIDSDVQEIFGLHQRSSRAAVDDHQPGEVVEQQAQAPFQQQAQLSESVLQDNTISLLSQLISHQQHQHQQQQQDEARIPQHATSSVEAQLQSLHAVLSGQSVAPSHSTAGRTSNEILQDILGLSRQYLEVVSPTTGTPTEESIKALLKLLVGLATEQVRPRDPEGFVPPAPLSTAQTLPRPQQQPSASSTPLLQELLRPSRQSQMLPSTILQHLQPQHLSLLTSQQRTGQEPDLQSILAQAAGIGNSTDARLLPQLLLRLQQQRQQLEQQQNHGGGEENANQQSPPGDVCRTS